MRGHQSRHGVEMTRAEEFRTVPKLRWSVAARCRSASPATQEIDVALAGNVEVVPISAGERAAATVNPDLQSGHRSSQWPGRGWSDNTMPLHY